MKLMLAVAAGGALGAVGRYWVMARVAQFAGIGFPYGTLLVNVLGSFALGALVEVMVHVWSPPQEVRAFVFVGVLGAFTTFSSFSLDVVTLYERGEIMSAAVYVIASIVLSVGGFFLAMAVFRSLLS